jgi:formylglycine-generating enzyme required for sulfatase activity/energy-coupling factor transporter ATP-binding protein EcfA2
MTDLDSLQQEIAKIEALMASLRETLSADALNQELPHLEQKHNMLLAQLSGGGAIAQGEGAKAVGDGGILVEGDVRGDVVTGVKIDKLEIIHKDIDTSLPFQIALERYLANIIATHEHLRLQGIRAGSQPLSVSLENVYVSLTAIDKQIWDKAPNGVSEEKAGFRADPGYLTISMALQRKRRLVIIGDPGCGKTTLISYLGLTYARTMLGTTDLVQEQGKTDLIQEQGKTDLVQERLKKDLVQERLKKDLVQERLKLEEANTLPVILPLRNLGYHLLENHRNSTMDGPSILLAYLREYYAAQQIALPDEFFMTYLEKGDAILLLDGMDEVPDPALRQRVARIIEKFASRFEKCRLVVTSREVGYEGAARIGANFGLAKVNEFSPKEVRKFIRDWTQAVEITLAGVDSPEVKRMANEKADHLIKSIEDNPRVADLAVNPLLLTVIALVHRYRAQLPDRRSELYEEAVEVLMGYWDEAKGLETSASIADWELDSSDQRSLLELVAFWMHEQQKREIGRFELIPLLVPSFMNNMPANEVAAKKAVGSFINLINMRSGLLVERGVGVYSFAHLSFQEYLAARALADRKDVIEFTLKRLPDPWWREVFFLVAGYMSTQGNRGVSEYIQAILNADRKTEPEPHHHLMLAAECLYDVGQARVEGDILGQARKQLQQQVDAPLGMGDRKVVLSKILAANALARIDSGQVAAKFWKLPYGEPDWIIIREGEFWMGSKKAPTNVKPIQKVYLPEFKISRAPVTNAQYALYTRHTGAKSPEGWTGGHIPAGKENHPVVGVSWHEASEYCEWMRDKIDQRVALPSAVEWEKAARGDIDQREYPWGEWAELHCNSSELGLNETTPVGIFLNGASPYGVLDVSGNVAEWTRSTTHHGLYDVCGGFFSLESSNVGCAYRFRLDPVNRINYLGFRLVVSPRA